MKKYVFFLILASQSSFVFAQSKSDIPYLVKSLSNASINKIEAETSGGNISVDGSTNDARIEVYIRGQPGQRIIKR